MSFVSIYRAVVAAAIVILLLVAGYLGRGLIGDVLLELYRQPFLLRCWTAFSFGLSSLFVLAVFLLGIWAGYFLLVLAFAVMSETFYQLMERRIFRKFFEWLFQVRRRKNGEDRSQRAVGFGRTELDEISFYR